jgi:membrane-bound lytic murein transglycosylase A
MRLFILSFAFLFVLACAEIKPLPPKDNDNKDSLLFTPVSFEIIPEWKTDNPAHTLVAFKQSCIRLEKKSPQSNHSRHPYSGSIKDWLPMCQAINNLDADNPDYAHQFFEKYFTPYQVFNNNEKNGLFTGYYEPLLQGSFERTERFSTPLYKRPNDLILVDLGDFRDDLKGRRIAGRIDERSRLLPYEDRESITAGALENQDLEIVWVGDPIAAFFLHIQGSGRIALPDGSMIRVGYDGQNGHPYKAIGKELIDRGALTKETVSLQTIRAWLEDHPEEATSIKNLNPSYVFFKTLDSSGPLGGENVPLTPGRSLAVDYNHLPYGTPIFIHVDHPLKSDQKFGRLMIAQDTGGAIRGPIRGDVFWGHGHTAEQVAGQMKSRGEKWILLPKTVTLPDHLIQKNITRPLPKNNFLSLWGF